MKPRILLRARILAIALVMVLGGTTGVGSQPAPDERLVTFRTRTMGTWASLTLVTADSTAVADLAHDALLELHRVDSLMTNWTDISEVARLNREAAGAATMVHPEVFGLLATAQRIGHASGGAFDPTVEPLVRTWGFLAGQPRVPGADEIARALDHVGWRHVELDTLKGTLRLADPAVRIDLGGIAKGYGVDRVASLLTRAGVADALIDLSGNMVALGSPPGRPHWIIGIRDPFGGEVPLGRLALTDQAVATSGDYEQFVGVGGRRYGHILDPRTGWPAGGLVSVTVVTNSATAADGWATALFVMGSAAARDLASRRGELSVVLLEHGAEGATLWVEEDLRGVFTPASGLAATAHVRFF
jgi:thiamine biosynthesis lipoprotein